MASKWLRMLPVTLLIGLMGLGDAPTQSKPSESKPGEPQPADALLTVDVTDIRDAGGSVRISIYARPDGFLKDESKAVLKGVVKAKGDKHIVEFKLPPGKYAVALFHDENDNGKLDTNFFGIPEEGYGVSNNPKPKFRAPKYKEALFDLPPEGKVATVSLQYI